MNFLETSGPQVKICGITNPTDAGMCLAAGADALGFNFYSGSSRYVEPEEAIPWIRTLGNKAARVAVVVNPSEDLLEKLRAAECFEMIQFHGDESPAFCEQAGFAHWIRAVRVPDPSALAGALAFQTPNILFDSWSAGAYGGTGTRLDWDIIRDFLPRHPERRFLLAGGLNPGNVHQAVRIVRPRAVDVASGVELKPGKKDEYLVREFLHAARGH